MKFSFAGGTQEGNVFGIEIINIVFFYIYVLNKLATKYFIQ